MDTQDTQTPIPIQPDLKTGFPPFDPKIIAAYEPKPQLQPVGTLYDVIIIGGGPAAAAAAVYVARKQMKSLLITESFGGQSIVSDDIQNWIGDAHVSGIDLAKKLEAHVRSYPDVLEVKSPEKVTAVKSIACTEVASGDRMCDFEVSTDPSTGSGQVYRGKTIIVASGARRRKMGIPGEDKFAGKGVAYCSTCDAPLFRDKKVAVVGGGNAGLEAVQDLFPYASEMTLLERGESIRGDQKTYQELQKNPKFKGALLNTQTVEVIGDQLVTGIKVKELKTNEEKVLDVGGIFVEIGSVPNSEIVKSLVQLNDHGEIMINAKHASTSHPGIFAAGDVTDDPYKQNNISAGDGVRAALAAYNYLLKREKQSPAAEKHDA